MIMIKKITLLLLFIFAFSWQGMAQFTENFDAATTLPAGWATIDQGDSNSWVIIDNASGGAHSPSNVASISYGSTAHDDYLITPAITVTASTNDRISFYIKSRSSSFLENYEVLLSTATNSATADFSVVLQAEEKAANAWSQKTFDLSAYVGQTVYVAIHATDTDQFNLYVDDFVSDGLPSCVAPTALAGGATSFTDATFTWAHSSATDFTYEYGATGYTQGSPIASASISAMTVSISSLTAGNSYDFYVQTNCGGADGDSTWAGPFTWMQPAAAGDACVVPIMATLVADCSTATPYVVDFSTAVDLGTSSCDTTTNNIGKWFQITAPASGALKVNTTDMSDMAIYSDCNTEIYCNSSLPDSFSLSGLTAGSTYLFKIWKDSATSGTSDVCFEEISCVFPTGLAVSNITENSADLAWTAGDAGHTDWQYVVQAAGTGTPDGTTAIGVTATTATAASLNAATSYEVYVRTDCGGGDYSEWSGPVNFTTQAASVAPDYLNDFETYPGAGWSESEGAFGTPSTTDSSSGWKQGNYLYDSANGKSAKVNIYGTSIDEYLISVPFDLSAATYYLNMNVAITDYNDAGTDAMGADDYVSLLVSEDYGTTWTELKRWTSADNLTNTGEAMPEIVLTGYNDHTKFALYAFSDTSNTDFDFYADEFNITAATLFVGTNTIEGFAYYPNPVKDQLSLRADNAIDHVEMMSVLGQTVLAVKPNVTETTLDISSLKTGTYFVRVQVGDAIQTVKVIKN
jgi:hypothetical protein